MDTERVLAAYDEQIRRALQLVGHGAVIENDGVVIRVVSDAAGWNAVTWSNLAGLPGRDVDAVIAAQIARFAQTGQPWEWKHYTGDLPVDLPVRLVAAGLTREPDEALMVAEIDDLDLTVQAPDGVVVEDVRTADDVDDLVAVHGAAFGGSHESIGTELRAALDQVPQTVVGVVARADGRPVSAGRVEPHYGTEFASIWGGGTIEDWRGRGVFRALVSRRARIAAEAGFRYLQVDAAPTSRPILERLGFHELTTTRPFAYAPPTIGSPA